MSGSEGGPDIETLQEAGQEFASGNISQSQLEQVQSGQASLDEVRGGGSSQSESENETETDQTDSSTSSSSSEFDGDGGERGQSASSSLSSDSSSGGGSSGDSSSPQATTNPGGAVGNNPQQEQSQQQQDGIDAPTIAELGEAGQEFASGGDVSQEDLENAGTRFNADVNNDGTIDDTDAEQLADAGQFEVAQELEEQIDTATDTEGDGTPDDLTAPTVSDVLGEDGEVSSAAEADALAEAARQSPEITQEQADRLLDEVAADEQGTVTSRDTGVLENQDFADQPGSAAFSRFDIPSVGGASNPAFGERVSADGQLFLDRRGSRGRIESITVNGQQVNISDAGFRSVGPETERGGDAATDRLAIDLGELGVDPGTAEIEIEETFGTDGQLGTETTQIEALVTEGAADIDAESFAEVYEGTQTADEVQNAISGTEAEAILGEETVDDVGGQQEAAAAVSGAVQGQEPDPEPDPQQQPSSSPAPSQQEQPAPSGETVIAEDGSLVSTDNEVVQVGDDAQQQGDTNVEGLAGNVGSVTDPDADTQPQSQSDASGQTGTTQTAAEGETAAAVTSFGNQQLQSQEQFEDEQAETMAAVNQFGQQQLEQQQAQSEADVVGDLAQEVGSVTRERDDPLGAAGDTAAGILGGVADFGRDARQFQRERNPIEDFAAGVREDINAPAPGDETADLFNQPVADVFDIDVQQTRQDLADDVQGAAASAVESGQDAFGNLTPQQQQAITGAATVAAAAEPTPVGEAALAALIGGSAVGVAASQQTGADETGPTESPFIESEIPAPTDPVDSPTEITTPDEPVDPTSEIASPDEPVSPGGEIDIPTNPDVGPQSEIGVPEPTGTDPTTIITAPIGEQRRPGQRRDSGTDTGTGRFRRNRGADRDELDEILSGGGTIGEQVREDIQDAIDNTGEFAEDPQTAQDIIQDRQVDEQTPDAEEQVGDQSLLEDIQDAEFGQGIVPGPEPIAPPAPAVDPEQTPDADTGAGVTQPPAQDQDPVLAPDTGQQPEVSPGVEQPATTPETGTGTGTLPDIGQQPGQQPDTGVDSGVDVGQQPDTGSLTDIISEPINAQQPQLGAEPTAPETTEPPEFAEPTGPGFGQSPSTSQSTQIPDRTPRLFGEDEEEDEEDPDTFNRDETFASGILDAESVFGQSDDQSDASTTAVNDILGR